jgi:hypothetical protein
MARRSSGPVFTSRDAEAEVAQYRPLCALAVVAMLIGILSALAIVATLFWFLPVLGIVLSAVALRRIAASEPALVGRTAAQAGLGLSVLFAVAAPICSSDSIGPIDISYYRWNLRQEAREFGRQYFELLAADEPEKACQLYEPPSGRLPLDDKLWNAYPAGSDARALLEGIVGNRPIHALLLLGKRAMVRYYDTDGQWATGEKDFVAQSFAVTFPSTEGETQTFFVRLVMQRSQIEVQRKAFWQIVRAEGDVVPVSRGGKPPQ